MALKPTIYKVELQLSDFNRDCYDNIGLTVALHPSETPERMLIRLIAFGLHYCSDLSFSRGLSATDEADLWELSPSGEILQWIEVGQASPERMRKAVSLAKSVSLYSYGDSLDLWWKKEAASFRALPRTTVWALRWAQKYDFDGFLERKMGITLTISDDDIYVHSEGQQLTLKRQLLADVS